jgi:hypothetical protein
LVGKFNRYGMVGHRQGGLAFAAAWPTVLFAGRYFVLGLTAWACNNQGIHSMMPVKGKEG